MTAAAIAVAQPDDSPAATPAAPQVGSEVVVVTIGGRTFRGVLLAARAGVRLGGVRIAAEGGVLTFAQRDVVSIKGCAD